MPRGSGGQGDGGRLAAYRAKRSAERTPEPFGPPPPAAGPGGRTRRFVVQQHGARRLHFDLRLEWDGVLLSWAVPRGPSLDPDEKRLAVRVEDHPLDYADFEGVIPEGNYGAGPVIVWDRGGWREVEDAAAGLERGKLLFELFGYKLRGRFTLVRTGRRSAQPGREWLLVKKPDAFADPDAELPPQSVLSGLTLEERAAGPRREGVLLRRLARLGAPRHRVASAATRPMLAEPWPEPFSDPAWRFELKYDGYRMIAAREGGRGLLRTRSGRDATPLFPEITSALAALPCEYVVLDARGRPRFAEIQQRAQAGDARGAARAAVEQPATLFVFDLLALGEFDARPLPLRTRRELLEALVPDLGPLRRADQYTGRGRELFAQIERLGLEGMVAKRADAPYRAGRSSAWRKIASRRSGDFAVVGYRRGRGGRSDLGALHLAALDEDGLRYAGRVGSGLDDASVRALRGALEPLRRDTAACHDAPRATRADHWVEPRLVCEVRYSEVTRDGRLRQPVFLRLRPDKTSDEIDRAIRPAEEPPGSTASSDRGGAGAADRRLALSNLDKVFWPDEGITKGDLLDYYRAIAPWLLPYLRNRPLVQVRHPDGIRGKSFFQKDAPAWAPSWVRTETVWSEHGGREIRYFVCDDVDSLLFVVNLGAIPLHVWSSRIGSLERPDWCILDLDPKGAPFAHVVAVARALRALADGIGLPIFAKTSGSEGLHLLVPLGGQLTYAQSRTLADLLAQLVEAELPEIATRARARRARGGRVFVDTGQNGHGKLLVAPFSVRPLPGAPVSMPLRPGELTRRLDPRRFTLGNAVARMRRLGGDPLAPVLDLRPDLLAALERLAARVREP